MSDNENKQMAHGLRSGHADGLPKRNERHGLSVR